MSKEKYTGESSLKTIFGFGKKGLASKEDKMKEFTTNDIQSMWDKISNPLPGWVTTLDSVNKKIILGRYVGSDTDIVVQGSYEIDGEEYITKLGDSKSQPSGMFKGNKTVESVTFEEGIDTSEMTDMSDMFKDCPQLKNVSFPDDFNTDTVEDMSGMFKNTPMLEEVLVPTTWNDEALSDNMFDGSNSDKVAKRRTIINEMFDVISTGGSTYNKTIDLSQYTDKYKEIDINDGIFISVSSFTPADSISVKPSISIYPSSIKYDKETGKLTYSFTNFTTVQMKISYLKSGVENPKYGMTTISGKNGGGTITADISNLSDKYEELSVNRGVFFTPQTGYFSTSGTLSKNNNYPAGNYSYYPESGLARINCNTIPFNSSLSYNIYYVK